MCTVRSKISAAAQELYLREGIEGVSMRKIAEVVGVSAPAIYRHFRNKDELLNEIVLAGLKTLEGYLRPALEADNPYDRLLHLTERFLDFAVEQPKYFDFAFLVPATGDVHGFPEEVAQHNWLTFQLAVDQVKACIDQGKFKRDDPMETAITVWAEVHGLVALYRTGRFGSDAEGFRGIYRRSVARLLDGLSSQSA